MEQNLRPENYNPQEEENIDLRRYLSLFISNWYWFAITLFISLSFAYVINRYSTKIYSVSSTLLIKDDMNGGVGPIVSSVIPGGDIFRNQQNLKNEMEILKSFSLNYLVIKALKDFHVVYMGVGRRRIVESNLYKTCPFKVVYDSLEQEKKGVKVEITILNEKEYRIEIDGGIKFNDKLKFGDRFTKYGFDFRIEPRDPARKIFNENGSNNYYFYFTDPVALTNQYRAKLSVVPKDKDASLVTLSVSGFVSWQEADYLNMLMKVYVNYGLELKQQMASKTIEFINKQLDIISDALGIAADSLERFRMRNNFIDLENEVTLVQTKLENSNTEKAGNELKLQYYNYLSEYLNNKNETSAIISPSVIGIDDQILIRLINELSSQQKDKENLAFSLGNNQPALENINSQIERTRELLKENLKNCIANINIVKTETERKRSVDELNFKKLPSIEKRFINIQRQFDLNNSIYTYLLEKRAESLIAQASTLADNRSIDQAQVRGQIKPRKRKI